MSTNYEDDEAYTTDNPEAVPQEIIEKLFESHYDWKKYVFELLFMLATLAFWFKLVVATVQNHASALAPVIGFIFAQFLVDFASGISHWACDTWWKFQTPIIGPTLIRNFRIHHVDPQQITRHGFVETNASTCYVMPPFIWLAIETVGVSFVGQVYSWSIVFGVILGIMTNEFHKWAHMVHVKPHPIIRFLQNARLIISHEEHHKHHQKKFDTAYCIINGWMNPLLDRINFWKHAETFIVKLTGAKPRADDNFWRSIKKPTSK